MNPNLGQAGEDDDFVADDVRLKELDGVLGTAESFTLRLLRRLREWKNGPYVKSLRHYGSSSCVTATRLRRADSTIFHGPVISAFATLTPAEAEAT
jgi:hypothetical protein